MWRLFVISLALVACRDDREARLAKVKDTVCACKTAACGEAALKDVPQKDIVSNHRTQLIARDMLDCLAKLYHDQQGAGSDDDSGDDPDPASDPGSAAGASAKTP